VTYDGRYNPYLVHQNITFVLDQGTSASTASSVGNAAAELDNVKQIFC
jgi:hypothetical protein